jgi:hypothetical protein
MHVFDGISRGGLARDCLQKLRLWPGCGTAGNDRLRQAHHTFDELYDHRIPLFIALCKRQKKTEPSDESALISALREH